MTVHIEKWPIRVKYWPILKVFKFMGLLIYLQKNKVVNEYLVHPFIHQIL